MNGRPLEVNVEAMLLETWGINQELALTGMALG